MKFIKTEQLQDVCDFVNQQISQLSHLDHIKLGPEYSSLSFEEAQNNLALYRLSNKFQIPDNQNATDRKAKTLRDALDYDANGITHFNPALIRLDPLIRKTLYEVRNTINTVCSLYAFDVGSVEITTGETFVSARGDTSVLAKLRDRTQWCVTPDCFDLFASICYRTAYLKKQVRYHYKRLYENNLQQYIYLCAGRNKDSRFARRLFWRFHNAKRAAIIESEQKDSRDGFIVFKHMMKQVVTFVGGARFTTVPKNNATDRVIECEALGNMIVQRVIAKGIIKVIKQHFNIDLQQSQSIHQDMILDDSYATIDLKNASNSNWFRVVEWFIGNTRLFRHVKASRSSHILCDGEWTCLNMTAPMGNGFTFELMTLILLCFTRNMDSTSRVFGDDIIIKADKANHLIDVLQVCGWQTNLTKTFLHGNFRESCGGFVSCGRKIVSYDFHFSADIFDALVNVNKLRIVAYHTTGSTQKAFERAYHNIVKILPVLCLRPGSPDDMSLEDGVVVNKRLLRELQRNDPTYRKVMGQLSDLCRYATDDLQHRHSSLSAGIVFNKVSTPYKDDIVDNVRSLHYIGYYLYTGRVMRPVVTRARVTAKAVLHVGNYFLSS